MLDQREEVTVRPPDGPHVVRAHDGHPGQRVALTASRLVLATVQNKVGVSVQSAVPNVPRSSFTINLNKAPGTGKTATVAWFVVN